MPVGRWSIFIQTQIESRSYKALTACNDVCSSDNMASLIFLHSSLLMMFLSLLPFAGKNSVPAKYFPLLPTVSSAPYSADK